jgi:hypothetical protein
LIEGYDGMVGKRKAPSRSKLGAWCSNLIGRVIGIAALAAFDRNHPSQDITQDKHRREPAGQK